MTKLLILKGDSYKAVGAMFEKHGHEVVYGTEIDPTVNVVVFTGGSDVSPYIYGEEPHGARGCDPVRDELEKEIYIRAQEMGLVCIGICRGGQLLNVLNGGQMIQDLGFKYSGLEPLDGGGEVLVDHHQGILPASYAENVQGYLSTLGHNDEHDSLAVWCIYPKTKSFCFQPHPEWGHQGTEEYFFDKLKEFGFL